MRLLAVFTLALLFGGAAAAQTPPANPVIEHFRAYRAAMESGDLATATHEAEQALSASETRDGDGGRTAVLALNLANVRLLNHDAAGAVQPAQRALTLSQNASAGVDPRLANLTLGRAQLAMNDGAGADHINGVLHGSLDGLPEPDIYGGAFDLGVWAMAAQNMVTARSAFTIAGAHADGSPLGPVYGRGVARTGEGASMFLDIIGPGSGRTMRWTDVNALSAVMDDAADTLKPLTRWTTDTPTIGERAYADAVAWQAMLRAKLAVEWLSDFVTRETNAWGDILDDVGPDAQVADQCPARIVRDRLRYTAQDSMRHNFGVAIVVMRADESGAITTRNILTTRGSDGFIQTMQANWQGWRIERRPDATSGCHLAGTYLAHIHFVTD